jgi:transposase
MNTSLKQVANQAQRNKAQRATPRAQMVYCVDLAKQHLHVNQYTACGELRSSKLLSRQQFEKLVRNPQRDRAMWVMEACAGAHFWGRTLLALGDQAKLVPPQFVAKQRIGNKNDSNDAAAIFAVHLDARVHPVPVKTETQQAQLAIHAARQLLVKTHTAASNHLRSVLAEHGYVTAKGAASLAAMVEELRAVDVAAQLHADVQTVIVSLRMMLMTLREQIKGLDQKINQQVLQSPSAKQLVEACGIGAITASAAVAEFGNHVDRFGNARKFSASLGLAPGEYSSGGKTRIGAITKRGNEYLRKLLVQGAHNVVSSACPKPNSKRAMQQQEQPEKIKNDDLHVLARRLRASKPRHVVVIAIANRMARMVYAMLKSGQNYRPQRHKPTANTSMPLHPIVV